MPSKLEELERLASLYEKGALTADEFALEKSKRLNSSQPGAENAQIKDTPPQDKEGPAASQLSLSQSRAYERRLWSFKPLTALEDAHFLLSSAWFACWLTAANTFLEYFSYVWAASQGRFIDITMSNDEALGFYFVEPFIGSLIIVLTAWLTVKKRSRIAAGFLIAFATLEFIASILARAEAGGTLRNATFLICIPAIVMAIQSLRATLAHHRLSAQAAQTL